MSDRPREAPDFDAIAASLEVLASVSRLELLYALRTPKALHELRVGASRSRKDENPERMISRQAIARHLELLREAGLVEDLPGAAGAERFALNHERLFALVDEMRGLARLRRVFAHDPAAAETMEADADWELKVVPRPRLMVAYGRDDGVAFALGDKAEGGWRIGRVPSCEIHLDYDPFLSGVHCRIERTAKGFVVVDQGSRNGTWLNWERLERSRPAELEAGDLLMVGRSVLSFQP